MKKLNYFLLIVIMFVTFNSYSGQSYVVPACSDLGSTTYGPMNSNTTANSKNRTAFILPASQLVSIAGGTITSTYFKRSSATGTLKPGSTFKIYLKNYPSVDFGTTSVDWAAETASATLVYDSDPQTAVGSTEGYKQFVHSANFNYTNGSNLAVFVEYTQTAGQTSTISWNYEYTAPCSDTSNNNTTKYNNTTGALNNALSSSNYRRPLVAFNVTMPPPTTLPTCATVTFPANGAMNAVNPISITWLAAVGAQSYKVNLGTTPNGTDILNNLNIGNTTSYTLANLTPGTYYYKIIPTNIIGDAAGCTEMTFTVPQTPANDECTTAISLTPQLGLTCSGSTGGNTLAATASTATLSPCTGNADDDVWYSFVATKTSHQIELSNIVSEGTSTATVLYTQVFSGTCGALVSEVCDTTDASPTVVSTVPGQTYYVRIYTSQLGGDYAASFKICILTPPSVQNDECSTAIPLTSSAGIACGGVTSGSTLYATPSGDTLSPCTGTADDDVWYSFVATSTSHLVTLSNIVSVGTSTSTTLYTQVLTGSCGALSSVACDTTDASATLLDNLTVGQTYYVRVYTSASGSNYATSFDICISSAVPPANDNCIGAEVLPVSSNLTCTSTAGTTMFATDSGIGIAPCTGTADDDVWYSFTATGPTHIVTISNVVSVGTTTSTTLYLQAFSGTCGSLSSILCDTSDATGATLYNLTPGQTYYVRIYTSQNGSAYASSFDICVTTPPAGPANDNCVNAVSLTVNPDMTCTASVAGTTQWATDSNIGVAPCSGIADDDVWYSFVATSTTHNVALSNIVSVGTTNSAVLYLQAFSGNCGALNSIVCDTTDASAATLSNLVPGQTYYVRIYNSNAGAAYATSFDICVTTPPAGPSNDECANAIVLTPSVNDTCNSISGTTQWATDSGIAVAPCSGTADDDVWYSFTATAATHTINVSNVVSVGSTSSTTLYMQVFSGSCGSLSTIICDTSAVSPSTLGGLTVGQTYYVRLFNSNQGNVYADTFDICITSPTVSGAPANDNCSSAIALTPGGTFDQNDITGSNAGATTDGPVPSCLTTSVFNVWYTVVVPASGNITIETQTTTGTSLTDTSVGVYSGSCGSLTQVGCDDDSGTGNFSLLSLTGQTPGSTLYVSVYGYGSATVTNGEFQISAYDGSLGTSENEPTSNTVKIYPNPFHDILYVSDVKDVTSAIITDISGRTVRTISKPTAELQLGDLTAGMYLLTLKYKDGSVKTMKAIKK
ncbi:T9SS type A sorting domain-containing protein [Chryseobacterium sp.]|uniref:T9SS type A sorting domain-containing protein n=1 Tax=Chryseobacterium sp. TaxID=1871047 RepID=UPI0011CBECE2|nr:T9SS type A sorting domain-containing protein [Chryseobacterium sp.]TXF77640.1 T9SS type A sorting domain-containing protein [Chryseobacterium sp.]